MALDRFLGCFSGLLLGRGQRPGRPEAFGWCVEVLQWVFYGALKALGRYGGASVGFPKAASRFL